MSEIPRTSLLVEPRERIDSAQLDALNEADSWASEVYAKLTIPSERFETEFAEFEATGKNPDLRATHLDVAELDREHDALTSLKGKLVQDEDLPSSIKWAYRWKVNELLGNVRIARASATGDMSRFARYNEFIYGAPDPEVFAATADWFRGEALEQLESEHGSVREAAAKVLALVPDLGGSRQLLIPAPEVFAQVRADHYAPGGHFALLFAGVELPERGPVTRELGDPILEAVRHNIGADDYTIADASGTTWGVRNHSKELLRPAKYSMSLQRFMGLGPGHEWTHVLECSNGMLGALGLAGVGLDRYERSNEGRALLREQVVYESFDEFSKLARWQDVLRRHFSISLGYGADGHPRSFGGVYIVNAVDQLLERIKNPVDLVKANEKARTRTKNLLRRTIKGTDGNGGAYLKDIVYLQGNIAAWKQAAQYGPKVVEYGDRAKYDISNPRHRMLLEAHGVIPRIGEPEDEL